MLNVFNVKFKLWQIIIMIILTAMIFSGSEVKVVEKIVEKNCDVQNENIEIYKRVLDLDNRAFLISGDIMENYFEYYAFNQNAFDDRVKEIEEIGLEKHILLNKIK